jgi:uncharacterized protein (TIGR03083 family)
MAKESVWPSVHTERRALADDLEGLSDAPRETRTQCPAWTVRDTVAHLTATAKMTPPKFFSKLAASGFKLTALQQKDIAVERGSSPADALARFRAVVDSSTHPPGPSESWLGEVLIHSEDIRRPLGIGHDYPPEAAVRVADSYRRSNLVLGVKSRIGGLQLRATDIDWSCGDGPEVSGPVMALLLAMTGRKQVLDELAGDGVATLRARP